MQQRQQQRAKAAVSAAAGDANQIPLGQREVCKEEEKKEPVLDPIPDVEWWDARVLIDPKVVFPFLCRFVTSDLAQVGLLHDSLAYLSPI